MTPSALDLARLSPAGLAMHASRGRWRLARWLWLLNEKLLAVARGEIKRLFVGVPPRHGKSELISKYFPAWYMGTFPDRNVILGTYEATFAASWGRKARDVLEEHGASVFGVEVASDSRAAAHWSVRGHGGTMNTAGVGGPMTGKGAHLLIIDDPVKNAADANSDVKRESAWEWYRSTAYSRLEPDGAVIILQTRWHDDDLAGRVLKQAQEDGEHWEVLELPALAEEGRDDPLGRKPGESLWPGRYTAERLEQIRKAVGEYWWSALYQQRPTVKGGSIFQDGWFAGRFRSELVEDDEGRKRRVYVLPTRKVKASTVTHFWTADTAATTKKTSDFTAIGQWGATQRNELLGFRVIQKRLEVPDIVPLLVKLYAEAKKLKQRPAWIGIEDVGVFQTAKRAGLPVRKLDPETDKITRAMTAAAMAQDGKVILAEGQDWSPFLDELKRFPRGAHDDQVDALSYAGLAMEEVFGAEYGVGVAVGGR